MRPAALLNHRADTRPDRALFAGVAHPEKAALRLLRLLACARPESAGLLAGEELAELVALLAASGDFSERLLSHGQAWERAFAAALADDRTAAAAPPCGSSDEVLAAYVRGERLRLEMAWLRGRVAADDVVSAHASAAASVVATVFAREHARFAAEGAASSAGEQSTPAARWVVIALGALARGELGFREPLDLAVVYDGGGLAAPAAEAERERFAALVPRALEALAATGFEARLHRLESPGPGLDRPAACEMSAALGRLGPWLDAALLFRLLAARPIAGDVDLGRDILGTLASLIFPRSVDGSTAARLRCTVTAALPSPAGREALGARWAADMLRTVRLQIAALQLCHGGRLPAARVQHPLSALRALADGGVLAAEEAAAIAAAYRFCLELDSAATLAPGGNERIPVAREGGAGEAPRVAASGAGGLDALHAERVRDWVAVHSGVQPSPEDVLRLRAIDELDEPVQAQRHLRAIGLREPEASYRHLVSFCYSGAEAGRRRQELQAIAPALFAELARVPNPDMALRHVAGLLERSGAPATLLAVLHENRATLRLLIRLFGTSEPLSRALLTRPEVLEDLIDAGRVAVEKSRAQMRDELRFCVAQGGFEPAHRYRDGEILRIAVADLFGILTLDSVSAQLSDLAEVMLQAAYERATAEVGPAPVAIVAMGKLGARELGYRSDLDLLFLSTGGDEQPDHLARFAQRVIVLLHGGAAGCGAGYRVDTRLRPFGEQGQLVTALETFAGHHRRSAEPWERQALIKARPIAGSSDARASIGELIEVLAYSRPLAPAAVAEIDRIRRRYEAEQAAEDRGGFHIKKGRGGLLDVEFVVQMLQLRYASAIPELRTRRTLDAIDRLRATGILAADEAMLLRRGYRRLRSLERAVRIVADRPADSLANVGDRLAAPGAFGVAACGGSAERYRRARERIRACYARHFERESYDGSGPAPLAAAATLRSAVG